MLEVRRNIGGGAHVEYDVAAGLVPVGDRLIPAALSATFPSQEGRPAIWLALAVRDGVPVCRRIEIESIPDGRDIRQADLAALAVDSLVEWVCAAVAARIVNPDNSAASQTVWEFGDENAIEDARRVMERARTGRPVKLTDERIRKAAETYRSHLDDRPTEAVAAAFGVAHRTAAKYVQEARTRGFLPPTTPGKKQA